ncbi:MAG: 30S ribosomal protein S6 [Candidatus Sungbacteria bacterium]|uniref:Small ribosomal subunit protein bS6 n=1 Tax=Candidatus Sungiibacteriota bacterium TaxID=2750080 RepID=A0A932YWA9_9BACT|nr:30S ribosomal protein S6 [Candidatus Sungbacteria bacterium]
MDSEVRNYEITYLIHPDIAEDEVFGQAGKITSFVQEAHGLVGRIGEPKKRRLAYPIKKFRDAYFGWTKFTIVPERIAEIEKKLALEKNFIRYLIVEDAKRPPLEFRPRREAALRRAPPPSRQLVTPFVPEPPKEEDKIKLEELDKKLEEILGK